MNIAIDGRVTQLSRVGISVYVINLVNTLARLYPENTFNIIVSPDYPASQIDSAPNIRLTPVAPTYQRHFMRDFWEQFQLPTILKKMKVDVYHSPNYILPFVRKAPCRQIVTMYDASMFATPDVYKKKALVRMNTFIKMTAIRADAIIVGSIHAEREFANYLGKLVSNKITSIYIGIPNEIRKEDSSTEKLIKEKEKVHNFV